MEEAPESRFSELAGCVAVTELWCSEAQKALYDARDLEAALVQAEERRSAAFVTVDEVIRQLEAGNIDKMQEALRELWRLLAVSPEKNQ